MERFWERRQSPSSERGYTLFEVMAVVLIIGILAMLAVASYSNVTDRSRAAACLSNQRTLATALSVYRNDHDGVIPATFAVGDLSVYAKTSRDIGRCPLNNTPYTYDATSERIECPNHPFP